MVENTFNKVVMQTYGDEFGLQSSLFVKEN